MQFERHFYPVGHGGFASETLGDFTVVFDCGSDVCPVRVSQFIKQLNAKVNCVDILVLSHFDADHVNCIDELIKVAKVNKIVIPYVPENFRFVYNELTFGAYYKILMMFQEQGKIAEVQEPEQLYEDYLWQWVVASLIDTNDWIKVSEVMNSFGLDEKQINNSDYVKINLPILKTAFESVFGRNNGGLNSHGLLMISQKVDSYTKSNSLDIIKGEDVKQQYTGCFYTGDADLKVIRRRNIAQQFFSKYKNEEMMLLCQLPHHGSCYNARYDFDASFPSAYYFFHDNTEERVSHNSILYGKLTKGRQLLPVRDVDQDEIVNVIDF